MVCALLFLFGEEKKEPSKGKLKRTKEIVI